MRENIKEKVPYSILIILCAASFLGPFMGSAYNLAMPDISEAYHLKAVTLTWFTTAFLITTSVCQIPMGRFADIVGRKKIFLIGVLGTAIVTFFTPYSPNAAVLILCRMTAGVFAAMMFGTNMAILITTMPLHFRAAGISFATASVYSALAFGPFIGGVLTHNFGWKSIFLVAALLSFAVFIMGALFLKGEWVEAKGEKFDYTGAVIYSISIVCLIYGFSSLPHAHAFACIVAGVILMLVFSKYEQRIASPMLNVKLFIENRVFSLASLASFINYAANSATAFLLSLYLQYLKGFDASTAGLILISQAAVQVVASLATAKLSVRFQPSSLATCGMIISVIGLFGFVFLTPETSILTIVLILILLGVGFGTFSSPNTNVIMSSVDKKYYGQASASTGTTRLTGQAFSMGIAAMSFSIFVGNSKIEPSVFPEFMKSIKLTFLIFSCLSILGIYASAVRNKAVKKLKG